MLHLAIQDKRRKSLVANSQRNIGYKGLCCNEQNVSTCKYYANAFLPPRSQPEAIGREFHEVPPQQG